MARVAWLVAVVACGGDVQPPPATPQRVSSPGPLFAGHATLPCASCHIDATSDVDATKCLACHGALATRRFQGKGLHASALVRGKRCETCHADHRGAGFDVMGWRSMRGGRDGFDHDLTGWPLSGAHRTTSCANCHPLRDRQGLQTFLGADTQCSRCHAEPHRFTTRSLEACERCHTSQTWHQLRETMRFDHDDRKDARMPLVGAHEDVPCRDCHANAVFGFGLADPDRCNTCHQSPHAGHLFDKLDCRWCHSPTFKTLRKQNFDHTEKTRFDLAGHRKLPCDACHPASRTTFKPPATCESCHADRNPHGERFGPAPACGNCHTASDTMQPRWRLGRFDHAKRTKFPLTGRHLDLACRACHRGSSPIDFEKLDIRTGCMGCHTHKRVHDGNYTNAQCLQCHVR